jgi:hypothetical protein
MQIALHLCMINSLPDELFDSRSKLLKCQRERLVALREMFGTPYRTLALIFHISPMLAYYICNPAAYEKKNERHRKRKKEGVYDNLEKQSIASKKYYAKKRNIYLKFHKNQSDGEQ